MNIIKFKPIIIIVIFGISCNKPATKNNSALLSLFITQTSGNCAVIEKTTSDGTTVYRASGKTVPSGSCRESTFFSITTSSTQAKTYSDTYYSNIALTLDKYDQCSELIKTSVLERERVTEDVLISSANSNAEGCIKFGYKYVYCKDTASKTAYSNKFRYQSITNAKVDMKDNYDSQIRINGTVNLGSAFQYPDGALLNLRIANSTEFSLLNGNSNYTFLTTYAQNAECFNKLVLGSTTLKTAYSKIPTLQSFFKEEITNSERKALSETITPELNCIYGTGVTATGESAEGPALGLCPSAYPSF
jgi:hypothetical protein